MNRHAQLFEHVGAAANEVTLRLPCFTTTAPPAARINMIVVETLKKSRPSPPVPQTSIIGPGQFRRIDPGIERTFHQLDEAGNFFRAFAFVVQRRQEIPLLLRHRHRPESNNVTA